MNLRRSGRRSAVVGAGAATLTAAALVLAPGTAVASPADEAVQAMQEAVDDARQAMDDARRAAEDAAKAAEDAARAAQDAADQAIEAAEDAAANAGDAAENAGDATENAAEDMTDEAGDSGDTGDVMDENNSVDWLTEDLRNDLENLEGLPAEERAQELERIIRNAVTGDYGERVENWSERMVDFMDALPQELQNDLQNVLGMQPEQAQEELRQIWQGVLGGEYGEDAEMWGMWLQHSFQQWNLGDIIEREMDASAGSN